MARAASILALALAGAADGVELARPNALLVVDENNKRVLSVPLASGDVTVFSPPQGAQENLLTSPRGIGTGPDGTIVVANFFEGTLVEIDPATGAQFPVSGSLSGPPVVGTYPRDVAVNPRARAPGLFATLGVAAQGELHQVLRSGLSTDGSLLAPYPSPYDPYLGRFVVPIEPGNEDPLDYVVATDALPALIHYSGLGDAFTTLWMNHDADAIRGLDAPIAAPYRLVMSFQAAPCPSSENAIVLFPGLTIIGSLPLHGGCPGPVAYDARSDVLYSVDAGASPPTILGVDGLTLTPFPLPFATLPSGTSASDMAFARVPEPGSAALGAALLGALAGLASARSEHSCAGS